MLHVAGLNTSNGIQYFFKRGNQTWIAGFQGLFVFKFRLSATVFSSDPNILLYSIVTEYCMGKNTSEAHVVDF